MSDSCLIVSTYIMFPCAYMLPCSLGLSPSFSASYMKHYFVTLTVSLIIFAYVMFVIIEPPITCGNFNNTNCTHCISEGVSHSFYATNLMEALIRVQLTLIWFIFASGHVYWSVYVCVGAKEQLMNIFWRALFGPSHAIQERTRTIVDHIHNVIVSSIDTSVQTCD